MIIGSTIDHWFIRSIIIPPFQQSDYIEHISFLDQFHWKQFTIFLRSLLASKQSLVICIQSITLILKHWCSFNLSNPKKL